MLFPLQTETQLLAYNKHIWVNGTTYGGETFNNLTLTAPNVLKTFRPYSSGQYITNSEEITIDVCKADPTEYVLDRLIKITNKYPNITRITLQTKSNVIKHKKLESYVSGYIKDDSYEAWEEYQEELFQKLPQDFKDFFAQHEN